jgi:hypothetical protein
VGYDASWNGSQVIFIYDVRVAITAQNYTPDSQNKMREGILTFPGLSMRLR